MGKYGFLLPLAIAAAYFLLPAVAKMRLLSVTTRRVIIIGLWAAWVAVSVFVALAVKVNAPSFAVELLIRAFVMLAGVGISTFVMTTAIGILNKSANSHKDSK
jgi:hypothetical protein